MLAQERMHLLHSKEKKNIKKIMHYALHVTIITTYKHTDTHK